MAMQQEPIDWRYRFQIFWAYFSGLNFREYPEIPIDNSFIFSLPGYPLLVSSNITWPPWPLKIENPKGGFSSKLCSMTPVTGNEDFD